jgi:hypothetical protein
MTWIKVGKWKEEEQTRKRGRRSQAVQGEQYWS